MSAKKRKTSRRLPAIVPRFLKSAVAIGAIPALTSCLPSKPPVVAAYQRERPQKQPPVQPAPADAAEPTRPVQPVVAAMMPSPVVAAMVSHPPSPSPADAGVDAPAPAPPRKSAKDTKPPPLKSPAGPNIYGVAAMFAPDPNDPEQTTAPRKSKKP